MARILSLTDCSSSIRNALLRSLRPSDEALLLPQSEQSVDSGSYKNVVFKLASEEQDVPSDIFSSRFFDGVTAVKLDDRDVEPLLKDPERRAAALQKLADEIPSEMTSSDINIGPDLDGDDADRDTCDWTAGFDSPACCVGLYCSEHSRAPEPGLAGNNRVHRLSFLVCRAGAGIAASTFHSRLLGALKKGKTLEQALAGGAAQGLRRVALAGTRNRTRILLQAAKILGFAHVESIADQASMGRLRGAVPSVDVSFNTLRKLETKHYQYSTALDCTISQGAIVSSNVSDGFLLFVSPSMGVKVQVRNEAASCIPFSTPRLRTSRAIAEAIVNDEGAAHVDAEFIEERFSWQNKNIGQGSESVLPFCFHGSHVEEHFTAAYARELGLAAASQCRLRPELVCLAGCDPSKLRVVLSALK